MSVVFAITGKPINESLEAQTARLRVEFLDAELDLTMTMIELVRVERNIDEARAQRSIRHIYQGLDTIRKFVNQVSSPDERARIADRLEQLEAEAATLATDLVANRGRVIRAVPVVDLRG